MTQASILCIEDDPSVAEIIVEVLEEEGFRVAVAADGLEGLNALREPPDLVLCDIDLPGLTGLELLEQVRKGGILPRGLPFIFVTALSKRSHQLAARELGCDDFISKPIDFELLVPIIRHRLAAAQDRTPREETDFRLTDREIEILTWVARGKSSADIATIVGVAERTVNFHIDNITRKVGVATRIQAAVKCSMLGIIKP